MSEGPYRAQRVTAKCSKCGGQLGERPALSKDGDPVCRRCEADLAIMQAQSDIANAEPQIPLAPVVAAGGGGCLATIVVIAAVSLTIMLLLFGALLAFLH
jgi:hypothetical protein